ncbi:MAG: hypothetical protein N3E47_01155 [Candidatus Bathyarchaeota archaeon]|nr:hypothetical protein [Candidatus Bathyarchaeota archaeon]
MKRHLPPLLFLFLLASTAVSAINHVNAETSSSAILRVNVERKISLLSGGYTMINDTFIFSNPEENGLKFTLTNYTLGVPKNYSEKLVYYEAYDGRGGLHITAFEDKGFKWLNLSFLEPIDLDCGEKYNFTVTLVFSGLIWRKTANLFYAVFPLYPSLTHEASFCNVTLILPSLAKLSENNYPRNIFVNKTVDFRILYNTTSFLPPYANYSSWVEFSDTTFKILRFLELKRELSIDSWGNIFATDFYELETVNVYSIDIILPSGATDISAYDAYGRYPKGRLDIVDKGYGTSVKIYLSEKLENSERIKVAVSYMLPSRKYIVMDGWQNYILNINITKPDVWIIYKVIASITLPEGASLTQGNPELNIETINPFQEKIILKRYNVTKFESLTLNVRYQYAIFWAALRPTFIAAIIVGSIIAILLSTKLTSRSEVPSPTPVSTETLKKFIEVCEEKVRITSEIEALEQQSMKGKISRKQYRLARKALEEQLSSLQKSFLDLKAKMEAAGRRYAEIIRRLEAIDTELEDIKRSMSDIETRYRLGEISAEERRNLHKEYESRREKAESIREEILLRLREEIL